MMAEDIIQSMNAFFKENRDRVAGAEAPSRITLGNEAADLDSMVSSIVYSYFQHMTVAGDRMLCAPVINIPRDDFKLRTEAVYLFGRTGIDTGALLFGNEIDLDRLHGKGLLRLTLVDHNVLSSRQEGLAGSVVGIIDHHDDGGRFGDAEKRTIDPAGSCATLVAEEIIDARPDMLDAGMSQLLLGTILLDTVNLDPAAKRVTARDTRAARSLSPLAGVDPDGLFEKLQEEKFNVASLDSRDLLRKDYKQWKMGDTAAGISSVLMPVAGWLRKDGDIESSFRAYARERGLDLLIAMNASTDPEFHREMVLYSPDRGLAERLVAFLNKNGLGLSAYRGAAGLQQGVLALYDQENAAYSRKKIQPLLERFFSGTEGE